MRKWLTAASGFALLLGAMVVVDAPPGEAATTPTVIEMGSGVANAVSGTLAVGTNAYRTSAYAWDLDTTPPTFVDLGAPFAVNTEAQAVDGELVVGYSGDHAYAWNLATNPVTGIDLGAPLSGNARALAVDGDLVVGYSGDNAYAWNLATNPVTEIDLGNPLGGYSRAVAISGTRVVGRAHGAGGDVDHAYAWDLATDPPAATDLTPSATDAEAEAVSGTIAVGRNDGHAYTWDLATDTAIDLGSPLGGYSTAGAVDGSFAVGASYTPDWSYSQAYAWNLAAGPPATIDLGSPLGGETYATAISGNYVVGASATSDHSYRHAYAWDLATSPPTAIDLGTTIDSTVTGADAISGTIAVGTSDISYTYARAYAWQFVPGPTAPSAPAASLGTVDDGSVTITWSAPTDDGGSPITGYNVYVGTVSGGQAATPVNPDPLAATTTSLTVSPLVDGTTYYFTVTGENEAGESIASNEVEAIPGAPSAPTALTVTVTRGKGAATTLSWTDHGSMIATHQVVVHEYTKATRKNPTPGYAVVQTLNDVSGTSTPVTGLARKNTYVFTVSATNPAGPGLVSEYSSTFRG